MVKHKNVLECRRRLAERLLELNILYVPELDPIPRVNQSKVPGKDHWVISVGSFTQGISTARANLCLEILREYDKEVHEVRKRIRPPKVNGPVLVMESDTPFTNLQKEIDEGMGNIGVVLGVVGFILICLIVALVKLYA